MARTTHGMAKVGGRATPTYRTWQQMKARCLNPTVAHFPRYGGRGIRVCDRWMRFENFLSDMGERPAGTELDRINNDGHYEPGNCRWLTHKQNARNRSDNRMLVVGGRSMTLAEWAEETGLSKATLAGRLRLGWSADEVVGAAKRQRKAWADDEIAVLRQHYGERGGPAKCIALLPERSPSSIHQAAHALGIRSRGKA